MDNKPRQVLRTIVRQYGTAVSADRNRCSGLLRDLCGAHRAETDASDVEIANNLGYALLKTGTYREAKTALIEALTLDPGRTNAWANLGQAFAEQGNGASAVACLKNAYRFSKNPQKTHQLFLALMAKEDEDANFRAALAQATRQAAGKFVAVP